MAEKSNIWDLELEVKALKTVLTENVFADKMYSFLKPEHFHFKITKALFTRLQDLMLHQEAFPSWQMLITDARLEEGVQSALKDNFEKTPEATAVGDLDYLCKNLNELASKRQIYATIYETQESLYDPEKSAKDIASEVGSAIVQIENEDLISELNIGSEYNDLAERVFFDIVHNKAATNFVPTGYKSFDGRSGGHQRGNLVLIGANSGGGKCQTYQALIPTTLGIMPIGLLHNLYGEGDGWSLPKVAFSVVTRDGLKPVEGIYKDYAPTIKLMTNWHDKFEATKDHKLLCLQDSGEIDFKKLEDFKVGDWLPKSYDTQVYTEQSIDADLATVLGLIVAEGTRDVSFTNVDQSLHHLVQAVALKHFDVELHHGQKNLVTNFKGYFKEYINTHCGYVVSADRYVPTIILQSDKKTHAAFLRGLFEGDGTAYKKTHGPKAKKEAIWSIELDSISETLIYQVKAMLENMGILCSLREKKTWATNGGEKQVAKIGYRLSINRSTLHVFAKEIGFISDRKNLEVKNYLDHLDTVKHLSNYNCHGKENSMPARDLLHYITRIREICKTSSIVVEQQTWGKKVSYVRNAGEYHCFKEASLASFYKKDHSSKYIAHYIINAHCQDFVDPSIREKVETDPLLASLRLKIKEQLKYTWARVKSVEQSDEVIPVYDLSVKDKREYSANGLMSHNSVFALNLMTRQYLMGFDVVMASYEMNYHEILARQLAIISEIPMEKIIQQNLTNEEKRHLETTWREYNIFGKKNGNNFYLSCPTNETTVTEIGLKYKSRKPTSIIFDYINLLTTKSKHSEAQWQALGEIAKEAKILAARMNCVVYMLIQIDKEHNLRYSQAIKDHANWAMGWVYDEEARTNGFVTVKQMKTRNAPSYDFQLVTRFDLSQFRDPDEDDKNKKYTEAEHEAIAREAKELGAVQDLSLNTENPDSAKILPKPEINEQSERTTPTKVYELSSNDEDYC